MAMVYLDRLPPRRGRGLPPGRKAPTLDGGTPETAAKLKPPPWNAWPSELQAAAIEIDLAVRLRAGASLCKAQVPGRSREKAAGDLTPAQQAVLRRYAGWCAIMRRVGWRVDQVLVAVVLGEEGTDPWLLRRALHLYATGQVLTGRAA